MPRLLVFAVLLQAASLAEAQVPLGNDFLVNVVTTGSQVFPDVAARADGSYVVVWVSDRKIFGRRLDAPGVPVGGEFEVIAAATSSYNNSPRVAVQSDGSFVVVWSEFVLASPVTRTVFARRFSAGALPLGPEFVVSAFVGEQFGPRVAALSDGGFVVVWHQSASDSYDIVGRLFDAAGSPRGPAFVVNAYTTDGQGSAEVAADGSGRFVVVWASAHLGTSGDVFGQRFDAAGTPLGGEFLVNEHTGSQQAAPSVAADASGNFVVVWDDLRGITGYSHDIFARRFDSTGSALGVDFRVNAATTHAQTNATVDMTAGGDFLVAWQSQGTTPEDDVFGRWFSAEGAPNGIEFRVNTTTALGQYSVAVAIAPSRHFVAVWLDATLLPKPGNDGAGAGIFGRRTGSFVPAAVAVDVGGNGILEPGEAAVVAPSWRNVFSEAAPLSGIATAFTGPGGAAYSILDPSAEYGSVSGGATSSCLAAGDCYVVRVEPTPVRPVAHWDARLDEAVTGSVPHSWKLHVGGSFRDVPPLGPSYASVEALLHRGVTAGCSAHEFCPAQPLTREQMAVFVLRAREGAGYRPPACTSAPYSDVPPSSPACPFIAALDARGAVGGCGGGRFCPERAVSREELAVVLIRSLDAGLEPPVCAASRFDDVPPSSPYCRWIEELARRRVASGCGVRSFCPGQPVTRELASVLLAGAFALAPYGP